MGALQYSTPSMKATCCCHGLTTVMSAVCSDCTTHAHITKARCRRVKIHDRYANIEIFDVCGWLHWAFWLAFYVRPMKTQDNIPLFDPFTDHPPTHGLYWKLVRACLIWHALKPATPMKSVTCVWHSVTLCDTPWHSVTLCDTLWHSVTLYLIR
jgi:hypothetical protein